jgi:hypothetical protein
MFRRSLYALKVVILAFKLQFKYSAMLLDSDKFWVYSYLAPGNLDVNSLTQ